MTAARTMLVACLACLFLHVGSAFQPAPALPRRRSAAVSRRTAMDRRPLTMDLAARGDAPQPGFDAPLSAPPIPQYSWKTVIFFVANPLVLLPFAALAASVLRLGWLGPSYAVSKSAATLGLALAVPLLALSFVADHVVPALEEVTQASKTISLFAMGGRLVPLRATAAASLISVSAAVSEELAFRGCVQTGVRGLLLAASAPARVATAVAVATQALIFGCLHSYTSSVAYLATATLCGAAFGGAFATTGNIVVPIVMHFAIDLVSFLVCHYQVARAPEAEQRELLLADSPIAKSLRAILLKQGSYFEPKGKA